ncbi:MAG TPA: transglutaminase domain-containing protein, partial [Chitinophagaceae bacterium]
MKIKLLLTILCIHAYGIILNAQDKAGVKFGKVSAADFVKSYSIDTEANAVVIADIGSSQIIGNTKGWFSLEFKRYCRIHLMSQNGFDAATVEIPLWTEAQEEERLSDLKAVTYNLENGSVVETKLDTKDGLFKDKLTKHWVVRKFTFPNIKAGSIIEFQYTITSPYLSQLQPWTFQADYPALWSEYNLRLPQFFKYVFMSQGYQKFFIESKKSGRDNFNVTQSNGVEAAEHVSISTDVTDYRWVLKDAPALKEESFVSTTKNTVQKIEFELTGQSEPLSPHVYLSTWQKVSEDMMNDEDFGQGLSRENGWIGDIVKPVVAGAGTKLERARKVYAYVRDNFTCTDHSDLWLGQSLKNVARTRSGTVSEINLLLAAMLRYEDIPSDPVILSTRSHGYTSAMYPMMQKFNYVIATATIDNQQFFLDATQSRLGFGKLVPACYNGHARILNPDATPVNLSPDSLHETKLTSTLVNVDEKGNFVATVHQIPGYYESHDIRDEIKEKGKDEYFKDIRKGYGQEVQVSNASIDSVDNLDENVNVSYDFKLVNSGDEDLVYITPMFAEAAKENPFKAAERKYPVEMPYTSDKIYTFSMIVPDKYQV